MSAETKKERVQFDFSPEALRKLDAIKERTDAATRAEVVRTALKIYEWLVDTVGEMDQGGTVEATLQKAMTFFRWLVDEADQDTTIKLFKDNEPTAVVKARLFLR